LLQGETLGEHLLAGLNADLAKVVRPNTAGEVPPIQDEKGIKEAIARNFAKKLMNPKKLITDETKQSVTELRNEFLTYLAKVYDNDTKKEGVLGCHRIIQRNCDNPSALRIIIAALCDRSTQAANADKKPHGLMFHAQMFGYLAQCFKTDLKDPLDKPPSLAKTVQRIQEAIYTFFKENSKLVWRGCAISL